MLQASTIAIVKATAPLLAQQGETLTRHFYTRMFTHNPEVKPLFNTSNQDGTQQRALAAAITAYAANIDNLEVLGSAVELITQKHASLQVKPEHYPIVGENLLAAIREVLGAVATDKIIHAWAEAYGFLADLLIAREKEIYATQANKQGGWNGFKQFRVLHKQQESSIITSLYLVPCDDAPLPDYKAGQYITVRVPTSDGTTMRNYSLSQKPNATALRISVKRESSATHKGYVSHYLHEKMDIGSTIELAPPCGEFVLNTSIDDDKPLVFIAAGIGITPIYAMLEEALESSCNRRIILIHALLNEHVQPFAPAIEALRQKHSTLKVHYRYSAPENTPPHAKNKSTGYVTADFLDAQLPNKDAYYYFCGPKPFMVEMHTLLQQWGVPSSHIHFEFFGPRQELGAAA